MHFHELGFLIDVSMLVAMAALRRTESRGAHYRADHPARDDERWLAHTFAVKGPDGPVFKDGAVRMGRIVPAARRINVGLRPTCSAPAANPSEDSRRAMVSASVR